VILFTLLTFTASWGLWVAASWILGGDFAHASRLAALGNTLDLLGVCAPALVA